MGKATSHVSMPERLEGLAIPKASASWGEIQILRIPISLGLRRRDPERFPMRTILRLAVSLEVDLASCLWVLYAILSLFN
ncbi:hypothetical protein AA309_07040 [Microvirga vignae]|uniref:Uncharacterized protein n=1 Tax=Microvirga vignae TaxID=1225564 RepID=A0A0H1RF03_9HYPH|nr:hypothetical protein AA309_07040 [Microvirga vignae]